MNDQLQVLRVGMDGRWEATELALSLNCLDNLYLIRFSLALEMDESRDLREFCMEFPFPFPPPLRHPKFMRRWVKLFPPTFFQSDRNSVLGDRRSDKVLRQLLEPQERLLVQRLVYGSPGFKDLAGLGECIGHLKELLLRLVEHWSTRHERQLANQRRELENQQLQVEIAKNFVGLAQDLGYTKKEIRELVAMVVKHQTPLVQLVSAGKIVSASTPDKEATSQ